MSGQKKNNMPLTQNGAVTDEAILAYLKGELSPENTTEFEKILAEDIFVREALEGLKNISALTLKNSFHEISKEIEVKTGTAKSKSSSIPLLPITRYAVAAILLGVLVVLTFLITNYFSKQERQIASTQETETVQNQDAAPLFQEEMNVENDPADSSMGKDILISDAAEEAVKETEKETEIKPDVRTVTSSAENAKVNTPLPPTLERKVEDNISYTPQKKQDTNKSIVTAPIAQAANANADKVNAKGTAKEVSSKTNVENTVEKMSEDMADAMNDFDSKDYKTAAKKFKKIANNDPSNLDAVYFEGVSLFIDKSANKALKNFDKLIENNAKHVNGSKWYKSQILLQKGKKEEAKELLNELKSSEGTFKDRAVKKLQELE